MKLFIGVLALSLSGCSLLLDFEEEVVQPGTLPNLLEERDDDPLAFSHPDDCVDCHQEHVEDWEITPHAYAAKDPVFKAMVDMGQKATSGKLGQFCVQCHSPTGLATGQTTVTEGVDGFEQNLDLDPIAMSGVTCTACHSMTNVIEPVNARVVYTPNGVMQGSIPNPIANDFHASSYNEIFDSETEGFGAMCGSCHNVINPKGARLEQTFDEFELSASKQDGETCVSCHMPEYIGKAAVGPEAPEGLPDRYLHRHTFVGVDVSLLAEDEFPGFTEMRILSAALLQESSEFLASYDNANNVISGTITNLAGHALPSGATAERQMWVELVVRNAATNVVFETGTLDPEGNLRDGFAKHTSMPSTDLQLVSFGQIMIGIGGFGDMSDDEKAIARAQVEQDCLPFAEGGIAEASIGVSVDMPWQADWQCDQLIAANAVADFSYVLPALPPGNYVATLRLLFRSFPPYFLTILEEEAALDPLVKTRVPIVEMELQTVPITVP
jgi:hypothetical protein